MKKQIASLFVALAVVLLTALPGIGASHARSFSTTRQFHIQPKKGRSAQFDRIQAKLTEETAARDAGLGKMGLLPPGAAVVKPQRAGNQVKPRRYQSGVTSTVGFVSATQIPTGGYVSTNPALTGDFNGDGKPDLLTVVTTSAGATSIAASLGNGDGTFQTPQITAIPANESDQFVVGDVNGDGKDDVVIVHEAGNISPSSPSSFDVFLSNGDGTFTFKNNYVVTTNDLAGGLLYDFNGDGKLDAVAVDSAGQGGGNGNVWVLLGNGDGTFQPATQIPLSGEAGSGLVFGDFNGDGLLDFADSDYNSGELTVYLGAQTPGSQGQTFAAAAAYTTPDGVYGSCANAVGDINGDGHPDIVSANCNTNTVTVYLNNGSGGFGMGAYYNAAVTPSSGETPVIYPNAVTVADVNGDGFGDIVSVNYLAGDVTVMLGSSSGTVQVPTFGFATGGFPYTAAIVADLNGDGLPDILVTDQIYSYAYMKGYGDGTFQAGRDYYAPTTDGGQAYSWDIASGDFNGDGFPDVVIGSACCDSTVGITVFLSNGDGTLAAGVNYGSGGYYKNVAVGDFNQDGKLDIAAVDFLTGAVQIFNGVGDGTFTAGALLSTGDTSADKIVVADFNGDGWPDLAVASNGGSNFVVFLNDTTGNFPATGVPVATFSGATDLVAADVNGDGKIDLLLPEPQPGNLAVFLGDGLGGFAAEQDYPLGNNPIQIAVGDVNNDGNPDVVATDQDYNLGMGIVVALGTGQASLFSAPNSTPYPVTTQNTFAYSPHPEYVQMTDLNGDGNLDLIYTNQQYGTVGVMFGNGDGTFATPTEYPTDGAATGLTLTDINQDGAMDVVTAGNDLSEAGVLLNNSGTQELPNYNVTVNANTATVSAGQSAPFTFTLTPRNFYNGTVTFSCAGLPSEATCSFSNTTLTPNGNPAMTTVLTIATTAPSTSSGAIPPMQGNWPGNTMLMASFSTFALLGLMVAFRQKKNRRLAIVLNAMIIGAMLITVGCGGGNGGGNINPIKSNPGTPTGTYTITVTATGTAGTNGGNTSAHNTTLTLTVQ